jgi:hypothetical protein
LCLPIYVPFFTATFGADADADAALVIDGRMFPARKDKNWIRPKIIVKQSKSGSIKCLKEHVASFKL